MQFWAKISSKKIIFYSRECLEREGLLSEPEKMRQNYQMYQRNVQLDPEKIRKLEEKGIEVLRKDFLALNATWHWFTGYSNMDAFRFKPEAQQKVIEKGYFGVNLTEEEIIEDKEATKASETGLPDLSKFDPSKTLFIVSCTYNKIWKNDRTAPDFIPARYAYKGKKFLKFLKWTEENEIERKGFFWVILSGKYGFIEPWHPISRYDINIANPTDYPISDKTLRNQVKQKRWWRDQTGKLVTKKLADFQDIIGVNCNSTYREKIKVCFCGAEIRYVKLQK